MPALRRDNRRLHARRAAADHHDLLALRGGANLIFRLFAGARIHEARHRQLLRNAPLTALPAADTFQNFIGAAFLNFFGKFRVSQRAAPDGDQIGDALFQDAFGNERRGDLVYSDDRNAHDLFNRFRIRKKDAGALRRRRGREIAAFIHARRDVQTGDSGLFQDLRDDFRVFDGQAAFHEFVGGDAVNHGKIAADKLFGAADNF